MHHSPRQGSRATSPPPQQSYAPSQLRGRADSSSSDSSVASQVRTISPARRSPYPGQQAQQTPRPTINSPGSSGGSPSGLHNFSRPQIGGHGQAARAKSPLGPPPRGEQHQQHPQGFFEPSLPTASSGHAPNMPNLTASQIAAQAAMQHQVSQQHIRKRSQTIPDLRSQPDRPTGRRKPTLPSPIQVGPGHASNAFAKAISAQQYNGQVGGDPNAAATAANAAYPRATMTSPPMPPSSPGLIPPLPDSSAIKQKPEKSMKKLFSKPKNIGIVKEKDLDKKDRALPSPNKTGIYGPSPLPRMVNASTTSLADSVGSTSTSNIYGTAANNSTSTLVPNNDRAPPPEKQHKHNFLSRQKHKLKDKDKDKDKDDHHLPLSSASSNSKPLDPSAPQSLYSFAPSSPGPATASFAKSMSGFDLRHGGRALREKKKEEKASAAATTAGGANDSSREGEPPHTGGSEWPGPGSFGAGPLFLSSTTTNVPGSSSGYAETLLGPSSLQGFGLAGMTPDDAWPFLKAKLLVIFEGEDLRWPVEDLNRLVIVHIQRSITLSTPSLLLEDLSDLLRTGFAFLDETLRMLPQQDPPGHYLVRRLVDMWLHVFGTILPYLQAVFLPLDQEFRGTGQLMTKREAGDFWGAMPDAAAATAAGGGGGGGGGVGGLSAEESLDVRQIVLAAFRDAVIMPRFETLKKLFSRLSLDSISTSSSSTTLLPLTSSSLTTTTNNIMNNSSSSASSASARLVSNTRSRDNSLGEAIRPGTSGSNTAGGESYSSQASTLLGDAAAAAARSRGNSNTSSAFGGSAHGDVTSSPRGGGASRAALLTPGYISAPMPLISSSSPAHQSPFSFPLPGAAAVSSSHIHGANGGGVGPSADSARVTETVGRMLQCVSVLASLQSGDEAQTRMEELARVLKLNWLGRGRTGRNRRGFVGARVVLGDREREREGGRTGEVVVGGRG